MIDADGREHRADTIVLATGFRMYEPNTNVGSGSIVHMLESQMNHIAHAVEQLSRIRYLEVREESLDRFDERAQKRLAATVWNTAGAPGDWIRTTTAPPAPRAPNLPNNRYGGRCGR